MSQQQSNFTQFNAQQQAQFAVSQQTSTQQSQPQQQQQYYGQISQQFPQQQQQQQQQNQQQQQQQQQQSLNPKDSQNVQQQNNVRASPLPNQQNAYQQQQQPQPQQQQQQQQAQFQSQQQTQQQQQQYLQQQQQQSTTSEDFNKNKFGLAKIDEILNNKSPDIQMFTFGIDLTNFGLNINDSPELYLTFTSPFLDNPSKRIQNSNYQVPQCYTKPQIPFKNDNFWKYPKDETLFYAFYNQVDEASQMSAVEELYTRGWQYHRKLQTWFKDLEKLSKKQYKCKYFSVNKWGIFEQQNFDVGDEKYFCTIQDFNKTLIKGGSKTKIQN